MRARYLMVALMLCAAGCKTTTQAKCSALRTQYDRSHASCNDCLDDLEVHGDESVCTPLCEAPCKAGSGAVGACSEAAREIAAEREKAKATKKD
ncbi:hypothetical protein [Myxococcus sp. AS-1-15]|uniref:hypothetical protein n=1 Tax=Myxococcus sp. AS-1-15 TaxID=2874600 RepID=UPI001CBABD36|nr:hypothetical protein [Myxococcus sp. AS-1-15]MBZ4398652.1 hypothetical protein [Myxococcus sp. AS-1-15]